MPEKLKRTSRLTVYGVAIAVSLAGCANVFGLSGYSFDEAAAIDAGEEASSMADVLVVATDAQDSAMGTDSAMGIDSAPPAPSCTDKAKNGSETDVDCGGTCTTKCAANKECLLSSDCQTNLACVGLHCLSPSANDGVLDGTETDVDCGGTSAPVCGTGKMCVMAVRDCLSKVCTGGVCAAPTPTDGIQNGTETDVDCGGGNGAPTCADGKACAIGTRDCTSLVCGVGGSCQVPSPTDGVKNGTETDVDCGGGNGAPLCLDGRLCLQGPRDCTSMVCVVTCQAPTTNDGVKNGTETDVDCGGSAGAPPCADGKMCVQGARDCTSQVCTGGTCQVPTNMDGVKNGTETDIDCGGGNGAPLCADGKACVDAARDCMSPNCAGGVCTP